MKHNASKHLIRKSTSVFLVLMLLFSFMQIMAFAAPLKEINYSLYQSDDGFTSYWVDENGNKVDIAGSAAANEYEANGTVIPASYDARYDNAVTCVKNQYSSSACWAFSTISCLESSAIKQNIASYETADLSEDHLVWFTHNSLTSDTTDGTYGDGYTDDAPYSKGGYWFSAIYTLARGSGAAAESEFPFSSNMSQNGNYAESDRYASSIRLASAERLDTQSTTNSMQYTVDKNLVKQAILDSGAVKLTYFSDDGTHINKTATNGSAYYQTSYDATNHAVTIVGWDDNYSKSNFKTGTQPATDGAWLVKNSWGYNSHLTEGYMWISYADPSLREFIVYKAAAENTYDNIYQYDGFGYGSTTGYYGVTTMSAANVFTAKGHEKVNTVGFYTAQNDVNYTVKVYKNLSANYTNPTKGTLTSTKSGIASCQGYHTVKLDTQVEVNEGEIFSVVIVFSTNDGSNMLIPVETTAKYDATYSSSERQSYYTADTNWTDSSAVGKNNVTIKAMTSNYCEHDYASVVTAPTCTEKGYTTYTCSKCGDTYIADYTNAAGHSWDEGTVTTEPACTAKGVMTYHCKNCSATKTEEISEAGHNWTAGVVTPPTCTEQGYTTYTCSDCSATKTDNYVSAAGHSWTAGDVTAPTCTEQGYTNHTCSKCGATKKDNYVAATGHHWDSGVVTTNPTCTAKGVMTYSCTSCDATKTSDIKATGHSWGEWQIITPATCTDEGLEERVCSSCDATDTYVIPAAGHVDSDGDEICDVCGETLQHQMTFWEKIVAFFQKIAAFFQNLFGGKK